MSVSTDHALMNVRDLHVRFPGQGRQPSVCAVKGVSLSLSAGACVGLVGESGCGKSSLANALMGLVPHASGEINIKGVPLASVLAGGDRRPYARFVQMVFQDPLGALNPRMRIAQALEEVLRFHDLCDGAMSVRSQVSALLERVGLAPRLGARYPHEISGGQRQRVCIARALAVQPSVLIADEPVSALDVSVQVQILNLLKTLQADLGLTILFISHDLATVQYMCDSVLVMYLGQIVERGPVSALFTQPAHPYTESLLSAVPDITRISDGKSGRTKRIVLKGEPPSVRDQPSGCVFHPRCPRAQARCDHDIPLEQILTATHGSRCHYAQDAARWALEQNN